MWRITPKGYKEAKNIFNIKKGHDLELGKSSINKREMGFEYFEDSVEIEVSQIEDDSKETGNESVEQVNTN
jgi:hypothetical protein